eukprot:scaffold1580_cov116-Cylindrotheca_fusiformis.AAC.23
MPSALVSSLLRYTHEQTSSNGNKTMGATQQLQQQVIQKYGWCANYDTDDKGCWFVDVIVGFNAARYRFQSTLRDEKKGKEAVSSKALKTLADRIAKEEEKPAQQLYQVFTDPIQIYDSKKDGTWDMFWQNKPSVVGIDVEGNQISPPVLVQISTDEYTILEVPKRGLSSNLERLLDDNSIVKVFCDNFSNNDKMCLGLHFSEETDFTKPPIVDIEVLFGSISGNVRVPRGLSKLVSVCMPELNVRIAKPSQKRSKLSSIGRFAMIEQGKAPPLLRLQELSKKEKQYAALDAWCTLQVYHRIQQGINGTSDSRVFGDVDSPKVVHVVANDCNTTGTMDALNLEKLKSDPVALGAMVQENLRLTSLLDEKSQQLDEAQQRIRGLEAQLSQKNAVDDDWDGPGSDDDTVHPIGSGRRKSRRKRNKHKSKNEEVPSFIGSVLAVNSGDQPKTKPV